MTCRRFRVLCSLALTALAFPSTAQLTATKWTEMGRRDEDFTTWTLEAKPTPARYVRLRAPRATTLHLQEVVVR